MIQFFSERSEANMIYVNSIITPMKKLIVALTVVFLICSGSMYLIQKVNNENSVEKVPVMPMKVNYTESASERWLKKTVLSSRLLDGMESPASWTMEGKGEMTLTDKQSKDGLHSLRLQTPTASPEEGSPKGQRWFGTAGLLRHFEGEDWTQFNRISLWVYPDLPAWNIITARIYVYNEGKVKIPGGAYPVCQAAVMKNKEWNQVVWEITDLSRDSITGVKFECRRQGNEINASDTLTFYIDQLELQKVDPDKYEGWNVAPGRIAFSHTGYQTGTIKKAIASDVVASNFQVINQETGKSVFTKSVQKVKTRLGDFQVMDFSEIREPGSYAIQTGTDMSRPFRIDNDVWRVTIWKAINFFYVERCGTYIPGIHRVCHGDWTVEHNGKRIVINGGWHDAGDLSQGLTNTSEAVYAMFELADRLRLQGGEDELYKRLIEEAKWGLEWVNKTRFGDGYRCSWATQGLWSNGIIGDYDDITAQAQNGSSVNFQAAAAEAIAARVLKDSDPELASDNIQLAREDFAFAMEGSSGRGATVESVSSGILAATDLYQVTGLSQYKDEAKRMGKIITDSQQRKVFPELQFNLTGFFYTTPAKQRLQQYNHPGHEQAAIMALSRLCKTFPEDSDWIRWYSAVVLHSEFFQKAMSRFTEPYCMLPNSLHKADEYLTANETDRENVRQQILNGFKVGTDWYVRVYAVQPQGTFRGNYGTMLSQTKAVSVAAQLRGSIDLAQLAEDQLHWVVGRNPFGQSTMYGEGYDNQPQYSAMSGDIVGSLPVGIKSRENFDQPYWPGHNHPNYKEVWVHPVSRWFSVMADIAGPAVVEGQADGPVKFRETSTGTTITVNTDRSTGKFLARVPEGAYSVQSGSVTRNLILLPASMMNLDLRPASALDVEISSTTNEATATVTIEARVIGKGIHHLHLFADNLAVKNTEEELNLNTNNKITWQVKIIEPDIPWVAVVVPDGKIINRHELFGLLKQRP
jgi:hypothetical protein